MQTDLASRIEKIWSMSDIALKQGSVDYGLDGHCKTVRLSGLSFHYMNNELIRLRLACSKYDSVRAMIGAISVDKPVCSAPTQSPQPEAPSPESFPVPIARHIVKKSDGTEVDVPSEVVQLSLSRAWLAARGLRSLDLVYIRMPDDSMTPTVRSGAVVVVDASTDALRGDGLYALHLGGEMVLKRLQMRFDGGLWIRSDNPSYREQELTKDEAAKLYIIGKAIWAGGEL